MKSMTRHIFATTASALLLALPLAGCGGSSHAPLDTSDPSVTVSALREAASERGEGSSSAARRFASEQLRAGNYLVSLAAETEDEKAARDLIARADGYFRDAESIAENVTRSRSLRFPGDRSLGTLSVAPWGNPMWREIGEAQGSVEVPAETMLYLAANRDFQGEDLALLADFAPGAVQYLSLGDTAISGSDLSRVNEIRGLRDLSLAGLHHLGDEHLVHLETCYALHHLNLMADGFTDEGLRKLSHLPALAEIAVQGDGITDRGAHLVAGLPSLKTFLTRSTRITDVGVDYLTGRRDLERLWLFGPAITRHSVDRLAQVETLEELVLMRTSVQLDDVRRLREALPGCDIDITS
jgi:hypothetical protein